MTTGDALLVLAGLAGVIAVLGIVEYLLDPYHEHRDARRRNPR